MRGYVALFRGINVGKAKRIAMADLRKLLEKQGYTDVRTLLNSGNALFTTRATPANKLASHIRGEVAKRLGVDALVIVKSATEIAAILADDKLGKGCSDYSRLLVAMTNDAKSLAALAAFMERKWGDEKVHVGKHAAYIWCANGILESPALEVLLKALAGTGTTRNWATMGKIHALLAEGGMTGGS
jgi:uncharacterized protein (DUF1697 family)